MTFVNNINGWYFNINMVIILEINKNMVIFFGLILFIICKQSNNYLKKLPDIGNVFYFI